MKFHFSDFLLGKKWKKILKKTHLEVSKKKVWSESKRKYSLGIKKGIHPSLICGGGFRLCIHACMFWALESSKTL